MRLFRIIEKLKVQKKQQHRRAYVCVGGCVLYNMGCHNNGYVIEIDLS